MDPSGAATASSQTSDANRLLAERIQGAAGRDTFCRIFCSYKDFFKDPTVYLINQLIKRVVEGGGINDVGVLEPRVFVMTQIPDFIENVTSSDYLRSFAVQYFRNHPDGLKIMEIFERSLLSDKFQRDLGKAASKFYDGRFYEAESLLRVALTIFTDSAKLQEYIPKYST